MKSAQTTLHKIQKGFTLIELLIVIAILGVLAAAVLSAINPVEQINRGRDTGSLSDAEQLLSAVSRFNAAQGYLPWVTVEGGNQPQVWAAVDDTWVNNAGTPIAVLDLLGQNTVTNPSGTGELLPAYKARITAASYNKLYVYKENSDGSSVYVCFDPQSGAQSTKATNRCASNELPDDYPAAACKTTGGTADYYCLP